MQILISVNLIPIKIRVPMLIYDWTARWFTSSKSIYASLFFQQPKSSPAFNKPFRNWRQLLELFSRDAYNPPRGKIPFGSDWEKGRAEQPVDRQLAVSGLNVASLTTTQTQRGHLSPEPPTLKGGTHWSTLLAMEAMMKSTASVTSQGGFPSLRVA